MLRRIFFVAVLGLMGLALSPDTTLVAQDTAGFTGSWTLDPDKSDNPREVMQQSRRGTGSNFAERGGRRGGRGGGGAGSGGGAPSTQQMAVNRAMMAIGMKTAPRLNILRTDDEFKVTFPDGDSDVFMTDKEERTTVLEGVAVKIKSEGKDGEVKVEFKGPGNAKVQRKFKLKDDGMTLEVESSVTNSRTDTNFKFKLTYRRGD